MAATAVNCPLCFQSSFASVSSLCLNLISVTTRLLECPICHDNLFGLDKFTIHLFGHTFNQPSLINFPPINGSSSHYNDNNNNYNNSCNNHQNHSAVNLSPHKHNTEEIPFNSRNISNKVNAESVSVVNCKSEQVVRLNNIKWNQTLEKSNENVIKFVENNDAHGICQRPSSSPNPIYCANKLEHDVKNCCNDSNQETVCDRLKKNLEPFLKYHDKSPKQIGEKESVVDVPSSFIDGSATGKNSHVNILVQALSCNNNNNNLNYCKCRPNTSDCDKMGSLPSNRSSNSVMGKKSCANVIGELSDNVDDAICPVIKIPVPGIKPLSHVKGIIKFNDNNRENSCFENIVSRDHKNVSANVKLQSDKLYQEVVRLENSDTAFKKTNVQNCASTNASIVDVSALPEVHIGDGTECINVSARNNSLSPIKRKEVASQAIQTIEESFTKTKNCIPNRFNESVVEFVDKSNVKKSDCIVGQTKDASFTNSCDDDNSVYCCDVCLFKFPDEQILGMHKQLVHSDIDNSYNDKKKSFGCHLCTKSFKMRGSLMIHRRVAHPAVSVLKKYEANATNCIANTSGVSSMTVDSTSELSPLDGDPLFSCNVCGKTFKKEQHLIQHEKTHDVKQWECDVCAKAFSTKYFLKKHRRLHTGEMPYTCSTCGKSFTFQQSYHKHLLYHSDEKPYVCCDCGRAFKELSTLHNHQRIHTGEKPFSCETCDVLYCFLILTYV